MTKTWNGSAGVCFNSKNEVLLVRGFNSTKWAIPSGGIERGETPEDCCVREMEEETGYPVRILKKLKIKTAVVKDYNVCIHYFLTEVNGNRKPLNDPDRLVEEASWFPLGDLDRLDQQYPEDLTFLLDLYKTIEKPSKENDINH
ncbi:8-oxo-dGTP diphosphatase [Rossellomorea marisflavi]